ncbi:hypothetical protein [uncultured Flavobacterium sp.]|uniref:hypothetical protein n=1 Tax=uncultured Flavobacterium sp. TaxID=165435 RepID=UPI0030EEB7C5|tara:strand:+ start:8315 stop:8941 length:627 start_codon:yes stop_codon:yes gene_type:complete
MKNLLIFLIVFSLSYSSIAQVTVPTDLRPGTLDVTGFPSFSQSVTNAVSEAGQNDNINGFESDEFTYIGFVLDPTTIPILGTAVTSEQNCTANVFRYKVFIHMELNKAYEQTIIEAKTFTNSGNRFPAETLYDTAPPALQYFGPRDLYPENGGDYITIPTNPSQAIKIMEFIGCRTDIPIEFRIKPSVLSPSGTNNFEIFYTVVASLQ